MSIPPSPHAPTSTPPPPSPLLSTPLTNLTTNLSQTFSSLTPQAYIRLIAITCGYLLLRPYLLRLGGKAQARAHEKDSAEDHSASFGLDASSRGRDPRLRSNKGDGMGMGMGMGMMGEGEGDGGGEGEGEEEVDEMEDDMLGQVREGAGPSWGGKARKRQRRMVRRMLEAEERRREEEDVEGIEDLLVD